MTLTAMRPDAGRSNGRETSLLSEAQASGSIAVRLAVAEHREHDAQDHPLRLPLDFRRRSAPDPTRQRRRGRARRGRERPQVLENGRPLHIEVRRLGRRLVVSPRDGLPRRSAAAVGPRTAARAFLGADSRAAPRGASARAAGGAAVVLERLADRGAGVLRAAGPSPTDPTSPMRLVVDHARPSFAVAFEHRLARPTAKPVGRAADRASRDDLQGEGLAWTARLARRPAAGGHPRPRPRRHHHHRGRGPGRGGAAGVDADEGGPGPPRASDRGDA